MESLSSVLSPLLRATDTRLNCGGLKGMRSSGTSPFEGDSGDDRTMGSSGESLLGADFMDFSTGPVQLAFIGSHEFGVVEMNLDKPDD
jgi:hypothetical protein